MDFIITPERQAYLKARGKIILNACPGSGKTTCIIQKLSLLEKECKLIFGTTAGIVCLSFTNIAKDEILRKYKKVYGTDFSYPHLVSTIDSFVNQFITLPFYNLIDEKFVRPSIVDEGSVIDKIFKVKYKDNKGKLQDGVIKQLIKYKSKLGRLLFHSYPPSSIWIDVNGNFSFEGSTPDAAIVEPTIFQEYCKTIFIVKIKKGLITSLDSAFLANELLLKFPRIGEWLVKRFPFFIVDEAQDSSELQHAIFDKLTTCGLKNIEMVGDPYQTLYEWRDASPQLFQQKFSDPNWKGLLLSQNRRSVQRVIDCFSIVRSPTDVPITTTDVSDLNIPVYVYKYTTSNHTLIIKHFEESCATNKFLINQIVVRGNALKDRMLGNSATIEPWKTKYPARLLQIRHHFESNETKEAVNQLRKFILELLNPEMEFGEIRNLLQNTKGDYVLNSKLYAFLFNIPATSMSFADWTEASLAILKTSFGIDSNKLFEFKIRLKDYTMSILKKEKVNLYFNKPSSEQYNIPITTIHQVKGATLDAILYFMDEKSTGQLVSFNDFKPSSGFPTEKQRMIYVACSRPKQLLALALPDKISNAELKVKFGPNISIIAV